MNQSGVKGGVREHDGRLLTIQVDNMTTISDRRQNRQNALSSNFIKQENFTK